MGAMAPWDRLAPDEEATGRKEDWATRGLTSLEVVAEEEEVVLLHELLPALTLVVLAVCELTLPLNDSFPPIRDPDVVLLNAGATDALLFFGGLGGHSSAVSSNAGRWSSSSSPQFRFG